MKKRSPNSKPVQQRCTFLAAASCLSTDPNEYLRVCSAASVAHRNNEGNSMNHSPNDTFQPVFIPPCSTVALAVRSLACPPFCLLLLTNMMRGLSMTASLCCTELIIILLACLMEQQLLLLVGSSRRLLLHPAINRPRGLTF